MLPRTKNWRRTAERDKPERLLPSGVRSSAELKLSQSDRFQAESQLQSAPSSASPDSSNQVNPSDSSDSSSNVVPSVRTSSPSAPGKRSAVAHLDIKVPERIGKYRLGKRLGSGTCGVVHHGQDEVLGRRVAVKLSPIGEPEASNGKVPGAQRAYETELFAAGRLRHPNIVTIFDAGQHEALNYLIMEAIDGVSLKHYGKGQKLLPVYRALEVIRDCCKALDYSHRQDILHRDIKPANIMVAQDGTVKLLDFGIAVGLSEASGLSRKGPTLGTPNYMSPEQILGKELGPASDFYSLGTVLFELLTGKQLFKAKKVKDLFKTVVNQPAPTLAEFRPDLPAGLSAVLEKALQKKPDLRFQSGVELIDALTGYIEHFRALEDRPIAERELIPALRSLDFFSTFSDTDIAQFLSIASVHQIHAGEPVLAQGNEKCELVVLLEGCVRINHNENFHRLMGAGECIGELGYIHGSEPGRSYRAIDDLKYIKLLPDALSGLPPKLHLHYYKKISDTLVTRMSSESAAGSVDIQLD